VDVSLSMQVDPDLPKSLLKTLQYELSKSIDALAETAEFLVVKFSNESAVVGGAGWTEASPANKTAVKAHINLLTGEATTYPLPGFKIIFGMRPRPDAIYFMTDGEFAPEVIEEVAMMNRQFRVPIHCICFGNRDGEEDMKRIAKNSRGTYTFVAGP